MTGAVPPTVGAGQVDEYLAALVSPQRGTLGALRETLRTILPLAHECLKYGMPAFTLDGKGVAGYAGFKDHCSYFPMSSAVLEQVGTAADRYPQSKGGLRFPVDKPLPVPLVRRLVKLRLGEISAVENGKRTEYFDDGRVKATGQMKDGRLHGRWKWYRRDGTLLRTGQFSHGRKVGTWETWREDGNVAKTTQF